MSFSPTDVIVVTIWEGSSPYVMARILGNAGTVITQATISSITCRVYDSDDLTTTVATPTVTVASTVYDTLQTSDSRWTADSTGYNWAFSIPASALPEGGKRYRCQFKFTPSSGDPFYIVALIITRETLGE